MLIIFDVEGVLVDGEYLPELAKLVGKEREVEEITMSGIRGEIEWEEGLKKRVELLKGVKHDDAMRVAEGLPLMKGAKEVCQGLKKRGWKLIAVSGGFSFLTDRIKDELKLDYVFSNELVFNERTLVDIKLKVNSNKANNLTGLVKTLGESKDSTVAVVDGANDLKLFEVAGTKVAFNAQPIVKQLADYSVEEKDLSQLLKVLSHLYPGTNKA